MLVGDAEVESMEVIITIQLDIFRSSFAKMGYGMRSILMKCTELLQNIARCFVRSLTYNHPA
jgi:hypothetical protein